MRGDLTGMWVAGLFALVACGGGSAQESAPIEAAQDVAVDASSHADDAPTSDVAGQQPDVAGVDPAPAELLGPAVAVDTNPAADVVEVNLEAAQTELQLFADLPAVTHYTYNGQIPGPTIRAKVGDTVIVHFKNQLAEKTTVHWHGLRIPDSMDGNPRIQDPVPAGGAFTYTFTVPDAGTFWYHPHVRSNEQVEKGLYGAIVVEESEPPLVVRERVVVLDDILIGKTGLPPFLTGHMESLHGRLGNRLLVNGQQAPVEAKARVTDVERWRLINTSNARTMHVDFSGEVLVRVVGTDGGLLSKPFLLESPLEVAIGQRYDLEVLYGAEGTATLRSLVPTAGANDQVELKPYAQVEVQVGAHPTPAATYTTPFVDRPALPERTATQSVQLTFSGVNDGTSPTGVAWLINGKKDWLDAPLFTFGEGETVIMDIKNLAGPEHPFHLHGQFFEVLHRNGEPADQPGLKDTVLVTGMGSARIRAWIDNPGRWMAHCHILEHAEQGMMSEIVVTAKAP